VESGDAGGHRGQRQLFVAVCGGFSSAAIHARSIKSFDFGVLLVGLTLGSRRGFAALVLYLMEGASGLAGVQPPGLGGIRSCSGQPEDICGRIRWLHSRRMDF